MWLILCCLGVTAKAQYNFILDSTFLSADTIATNLNAPFEIQYGLDSWVWVTERYGILSKINPDDGYKDTLLNITTLTTQQGESGLTGFCFHPEFADTPFLYLVYSYLDAGMLKNKLVRYLYNGNALTNPQVMLDNIPTDSSTASCRVIIGPDRKLYMTLGDDPNLSQAQNIAMPFGKIIRMNLNGSVPADNPVTGSYAWSWGYSYPTGMTFGPDNRLYVNDVGNAINEELNLVQKGKNYGWPTVKGFCDSMQELSFCADSDVIEPLDTWSATGLADLTWYDHPAIPEWRGALLAGCLQQDQLKQFTLDSSGAAITNERDWIQGYYGTIRDVVVDPTGRVFIATNGTDNGNAAPFTHTIVQMRNVQFTGAMEVDAGSVQPACEGVARVLGGNPTAQYGIPPYQYQWYPPFPVALDCYTCPNPIFTGPVPRVYLVVVTDFNGNMASDTVYVDVYRVQQNPDSSGLIRFDWTDSTHSAIEVSTTASMSDYLWAVSWGDSTELPIQHYDSSFTETLQNIQCDHNNPHEACWVNLKICLSTDTATCMSACIDTMLFLFGNSTGIIEPQNPKVQIWPNPATDVLYIESGNEKIDHIILYNSNGQLLQDISTSEISKISLDITQLPAGLYFIQVITSKRQAIKKLLVD